MIQISNDKEIEFETLAYQTLLDRIKHIEGPTLVGGELTQSQFIATQTLMLTYLKLFDPLPINEYHNIMDHFLKNLTVFDKSIFKSQFGDDEANRYLKKCDIMHRLSDKLLEVTKIFNEMRPLLD